MDRIPIALGLILIVFFGLRVSSWVTGTLFFSAMVVPLSRPCRIARAWRLR